MSPWNRDALVSLRENLQLNVLMDTGLNNRLVEAAGGFMNRFEAATVRQQSGNIEQMGKVIDILCGKSDKDFSTFLQMLQGSNNQVWAKELERKACRRAQERKRCVCLERKEATQRYSAQCLFSTPLPGLQRCTALLHFERLIDLMYLQYVYV